MVAVSAPGEARGSSAYRLVRPPARGSGTGPVLEPGQQAVVDHRGGPLLVLAGPGSGKTTTLVEAAVRRVADGADPESLLLLTFSPRGGADPGGGGPPPPAPRPRAQRRPPR